MIKPNSSYFFQKTGKKVKNRTVLAAMTNKQSHDDGFISKDEINWLTCRAKGGFGIITTAASHVSKSGQGWEGEFGLFDDLFIDGLSNLTKNVKAYGSVIMAQLFHGGSRSPQKLTGKQPLSASRISCDFSKTGFTKNASEKDIEVIINDFTAAAIRCVDAGFDGIELHGAHGYLLSQFLSKKINNRIDKYGGKVHGRSKLLRDIYISIRKNVPETFLVGIRISPEIKNFGITLDDSLELVKILRDLDIDFIHISCWDIYAPSITYPDNPKTLTEWIRDSFYDLPPIISTGNIWSAIDAHNAIKQGADLIGAARVAIPYPDWPKNLNIDSYNPKKAPFSVAQLRQAMLSEKFIKYMRNWDGFVI